MAKKKSQVNEATGPSRYLVKLSQSLFETETEQKAFVDFVSLGRARSQALVWTQQRPEPNPFQIQPALAFQPEFVDRLIPSQHPGRHALHENGAYYLLDYASVMMTLPLQFIPETIASVLDLCAAPGGKSVLAASYFKPQSILANEVVGKRVAALISNFKRLRISASVTSSDPSYFQKETPDSFDLVIVDAPCSGQSLLAKGEEAIGCFHPVNIKKCMVRQRRIIASASDTVKPGGYLLYSTCTYSVEENEEVCEWFLKKFPDFEAIDIPELNSFRSGHSAMPCYRFFPDAEYGAGGFSALFKKKGALAPSSFDTSQISVRWSSDSASSH